MPARSAPPKPAAATKRPKKSPPLWGFVDRQGRLVVPPTYADCGSFREGRAPVTDGKRWGYIGPDGRLVVPMRYRDASLFFRGHGVVVRDEASGHGFCVDLTGREQAELRWVRPDGLTEVIEGPVEHAELDEPLGTRRWLFPDGSPTPGEPLGRDRFARQGSFVDGPARLLDPTGRVLATIGDHIGPFSCERAVLSIDGAYSFMRPDGTVLRGRWEYVTPMREERAIVRLPGGGDGVIDPEGALVYPSASAPPKGKKKKPAGLASATPFTHGRSVAEVDGRFGLLDRDGAFVLAPSLTTLYGPHAARWHGTRDDDKSVLVAADGTCLDLGGTDAFAIEGGPWFGLRRDGKYGVVDADGREVLPFDYDALGRAGPLLEVNHGADEDGEGGRFGFVDLATQSLVVPIVYLEVGAFRDQALAAVLAPVGDESGDYPFRVYGAAPDDWASGPATWRLRFVAAPTPAERKRVEARLGGVRWEGAFALATWDSGSHPARPLRAIEAVHRAVPLREAVLLEARTTSSGSSWEAWSVRRQARPDAGPDFGLASLYWRID